MLFLLLRRSFSASDKTARVTSKGDLITSLLIVFIINEGTLKLLLYWLFQFCKFFDFPSIGFHRKLVCHTKILQYTRFKTLARYEIIKSSHIYLLFLKLLAERSAL